MTYRIYKPTQDECKHLGWAFDEDQFVILTDTSFYWYNGPSAFSPSMGCAYVFSRLEGSLRNHIDSAFFAFSSESLVIEFSEQTHPELFV